MSNGDGPATTRLCEVLRTLAWAKAEDRGVEVLRSVFAEENAVLYTTARTAMADRLLPRLTAIVSAGCDEGSFTVADPEASARVVLSLLQECTDRVGRMLIDVADGAGSGRMIESQAAVYVDALHRTLGAAPGTLAFIDAADVRRWVQAARGARPTTRQECA